MEEQGMALFAWLQLALQELRINQVHSKPSTQHTYKEMAFKATISNIIAPSKIILYGLEKQGKTNINLTSQNKGKITVEAEKFFSTRPGNTHTDIKTEIKDNHDS